VRYIETSVERSLLFTSCTLYLYLHVSPAGLDQCYTYSYCLKFILYVLSNNRVIEFTGGYVYIDRLVQSDINETIQRRALYSTLVYSRFPVFRLFAGNERDE